MLAFFPPGKPSDNAVIESSKGESKAECLNAHWLINLEDAVQQSEAWCGGDDEVRPQGSIGNTPQRSSSTGWSYRTHARRTTAEKGHQRGPDSGWQARIPIGLGHGLDKARG